MTFSRYLSSRYGDGCPHATPINDRRPSNLLRIHDPEG